MIAYIVAEFMGWMEINSTSTKRVLYSGTRLRCLELEAKLNALHDKVR